LNRNLKFDKLSNIINFFLVIAFITIWTLIRFITIVVFLSSNLVLVLDFNFLATYSCGFNFIILIDFYRIIFLFSVMLISRRVFTFRSSYMRVDKHFNRFHFLLSSFVASIILLVLSPNLVRILAGWDGLGVSSYLLVIYYTRAKSFNSGMVTFLSNRVGDSFMIMRVPYFIILPSLNRMEISYFSDRPMTIIVVVILASLTKSAQIPFRAWLPAAIAAPTPVSSLVHSSTLVTAGVYLLFRFERLLVKLNLNIFVIIVGSLTMFIARTAAFFEIDMKKIVALSTLRQLGVIMTSIGAGYRNLAFFHLLRHAYFKALLFIRTGNLIHAAGRFQDSRAMGGMSEIIPFTNRVLITASFRLCGLPFISAFYSKEIIIEGILIKEVPVYSYLIIVMGIFITVFYRVRFLVSTFIWVSRQSRISMKNDLNLSINIRILTLLIPAITGGSAINHLIDLNVLFLVSEKAKVFSFLLIIGGVKIAVNIFQGTICNSERLSWSLSSLWILPLYSSRLPVEFSINWGDFLRKRRDYSWVYYGFSSWVIRLSRFSVHRGASFQRSKFIRVINIIFLILAFRLISVIQ